MDIGLFHPWIHSKGGAEKLILEILENSEHNITLYTAVYKPNKTFPEFQNYNIQVVGNIPIKGYLFRGLAFTALFFTKKLPNHDKIVISTAGVAEFLNFRNRNQEIIGYCHTPLKAAHDPDTIKQNKERMNSLIKPIYKIAVKTYKIIEKQAWKQFDHVQFNSENTLKRATNAKLIEKENTSINHPGADIHNKTGRYQKYFLYPSRFAPYKRHLDAIEAYQKFKEQNPETKFKLILAGSTQDEKQKYIQKVKEKASEVEGVELKLNAPGNKWEELYQKCYTVIFTSKGEDWGIVPIEAMSYGKPIIAYNSGGPTESIINGKTGFLTQNTEEIAEKMEELAANPEKAKGIGLNAKEHSKKYSWEKFVQKFDQIIAKN